jgi:2-dehydro-3-deoxyphosphogluconate aldolase/(4S)-4-hydroxy-2-oxoglutarate aldolase
MSVIEKLSLQRVLPVLVIDDAADAVPLCRAIYAGGLSFAEVTFRTDAAAESIRNIRSEMPEMTVGAGTVVRVSQVEEAAGAGAQFLVSPGLNPAVAKRAKELNIPIIPGCITPTEIEAAMSLDITVLKFFPAQQAGGADFIKACSAPYPDIRFVPTGGVGTHNLKQYLSLDCVIACGGSWMAPAALIKSKSWDEITGLCAQAKEIAGI